jgi:hypothetical protein
MYDVTHTYHCRRTGYKRKEELSEDTCANDTGYWLGNCRFTNLRRSSFQLNYSYSRFYGRYGKEIRTALFLNHGLIRAKRRTQYFYSK